MEPEPTGDTVALRNKSRGLTLLIAETKQPLQFLLENQQFQHSVAMALQRGNIFQFYFLVKDVGIDILDCKLNNIPVPFLILDAVKRQKEALTATKKLLSSGFIWAFFKELLSALTFRRGYQLKGLRVQLKHAKEFYHGEVFRAKELFRMIFQKKPYLLKETGQGGEALADAVARLAAEYEKSMGVKDLTDRVKYYLQANIEEASS